MKIKKGKLLHILKEEISLMTEQEQLTVDQINDIVDRLINKLDSLDLSLDLIYGAIIGQPGAPAAVGLAQKALGRAVRGRVQPAHGRINEVKTKLRPRRQGWSSRLSNLAEGPDVSDDPEKEETFDLAGWISGDTEKKRKELEDIKRKDMNSCRRAMASMLDPNKWDEYDKAIDQIKDPEYKEYCTTITTPEAPIETKPERTAAELATPTTAVEPETSDVKPTSAPVAPERTGSGTEPEGYQGPGTWPRRAKDSFNIVLRYPDNIRLQGGGGYNPAGLGINRALKKIIDDAYKKHYGKEPTDVATAQTVKLMAQALRKMGIRKISESRLKQIAFEEITAVLRERKQTLNRSLRN